MEPAAKRLRLDKSPSQAETSASPQPSGAPCELAPAKGTEDCTPQECGRNSVTDGEGGTIATDALVRAQGAASELASDGAMGAVPALQASAPEPPADGCSPGRGALSLVPGADLAGEGAAAPAGGPAGGITPKDGGAAGQGGGAAAAHEASNGRQEVPSGDPDTGGGGGGEGPGGDWRAPGAAGKAQEAGAGQGKYTAREAQWQEVEREGALRFEYVLNDGQPHNSIWLVGLKNVFSKQLPNMPKEYISRLVFDRRHRSVAIVQQDNTVTGGITYRPFHSQRFAEIAFCAVTGPQQVRGFGTRLMNYTKLYARERDGCEYFLTYADNSAVGYFSKQSFSKEISMPKDRWHGFIKDYDGGTLMECHIHPHLPFTDFPGMIQAQKQALDQRIRQYTSSHIVYRGIDYWKEGGGAGAKPPMCIDDIPGVATAGWSSEIAARLRPKFRVVLNGAAVEPSPDNLQAFMKSLLLKVKRDEDSWPFREPVTEELAPDYSDVIKAPMDLSTMEARLDSRQFYITLDIFVADMNRIFNNSKIYNSSDTVYYKLAAKLQVQFQQLVNANVIHDSAQEAT